MIIFEQEGAMFDFFWFNSFRYNLGRFFDDYLIFYDIIGCFGTWPVRNKHDDEYYDEIEKKTATKPGKDTLQCAYEYRFLSFHFVIVDNKTRLVNEISFA